MVLAGADMAALERPRERPLVGSPYPRTASRFLAAIPHILVEQEGCVEGLCPSWVDVVLDIVETGATLRAHGLEILCELGELEVHLVRRKPGL